MTAIRNQETARRIVALATSIASPERAFAADHVKAAEELGYRVGLIETSDPRYETYAVHARPGEEIDPDVRPLVAVILGDATRYFTMREPPRTYVAAAVTSSAPVCPPAGGSPARADHSRRSPGLSALSREYRLRKDLPRRW